MLWHGCWHRRDKNNKQEKAGWESALQFHVPFPVFAGRQDGFFPEGRGEVTPGAE